MKRLITTSSISARHPPLIIICNIFFVCIILTFLYADESIHAYFFLSNTKRLSTIYVLLCLYFCTNNISQRYFQVSWALKDKQVVKAETGI